MKNVVLNVDGMSCMHCEARVKKAVSALHGVSSVQVDLAEKTVAVEFDPTAADEEQIKEAIEEQGYTVK